MAAEIPYLYPTVKPWHGIERPLACGHEPSPQYPGYAISPYGAHVCYSCAPAPGGTPMKRFRLTGNYGTFVVQRDVEAVDEDAAFEQTGIAPALTAAGWTIVESPDGEEWDITEVTDESNINLENPS